MAQEVTDVTSSFSQDEDEIQDHIDDVINQFDIFNTGTDEGDQSRIFSSALTFDTLPNSALRLPIADVPYPSMAGSPLVHDMSSGLPMTTMSLEQEAEITHSGTLGSTPSMRSASRRASGAATQNEYPTRLTSRLRNLPVPTHEGLSRTAMEYINNHTLGDIIRVGLQTLHNRFL